MSKPPRKLPEYEAPPVNEVALGVSFTTIENFKVPHFGLYWEKVRKLYPKSDAQPPVAIVLETAKPSPTQQSLQISSDPNLVRCWFIDESDNNLIQLQPDKFIRNWRHIDGSDQKYPRYAILRNEFKRDWDGFTKFLKENELAVPNVIQCEVTYINNIEQGSGWETFADLHKVLAFWKGPPSDGFISVPESVSIALAYSMDKPTDRMRVNFQHVMRLTDGKDIGQFSLVARMTPASAKEKDILACFDKSHEWIVKAFTDLTTPEMHSLWKRSI